LEAQQRAEEEMIKLAMEASLQYEKEKQEQIDQ
jgi:hypothetical protein